MTKVGINVVMLSHIFRSTAVVVYNFSELYSVKFVVQSAGSDEVVVSLTMQQAA